MIKIIYKLVNLVVSVLGGILAGAIFKRIWKAAAGEDEAPRATNAQSGWRVVLVAATQYLSAAMHLPGRSLPEARRHGACESCMATIPAGLRPRATGRIRRWLPECLPEREYPAVAP
jgi:hypothetical protein